MYFNYFDLTFRVLQRTFSKVTLRSLSISIAFKKFFQKINEKRILWKMYVATYDTSSRISEMRCLTIFITALCYFSCENSKAEEQESINLFYCASLTSVWVLLKCQITFLLQGEEAYAEAIKNMKMSLSTILDLKKQFAPPPRIIQQIEEMQRQLRGFVSSSPTN